MKKAIILILGFVIIIALVVAVGASKKTGQTNSDQPASNHPTSSGASTTPASSDAVNIQNYAFGPASMTVKKGTSVTWTNMDTARHDITVDDGTPAGGPASELLAKGQMYSFTFNTVGTFKYHCSPHPYMHGSVTVTE